MTMFTEGRLQAYERMMRQTYMSRGRNHGSKRNWIGSMPREKKSASEIWVLIFAKWQWMDTV